jgi:hypothetical protein
MKAKIPWIAFLAITPLLLLGVVVQCRAAADSASAARPNRLILRKGSDGRDALIWQSTSGREVNVKGMVLVIEDERNNQAWSVAQESDGPILKQNTAVFKYRISLGDKRRSITGRADIYITPSTNGDEDVLLCKSSLVFDKAVELDLAVRCIFDLLGTCPDKMTTPERSGVLSFRSLQPNTVENVYFRLGRAAEPVGVELGLPVIDLSWNDSPGKEEPLRLAAAVDPYCGCSISAATRPAKENPSTRVVISTLYKGSLVPLVKEERTISLEFHRKCADGSLRSFYRTIPEIEPGPAWIHGIHLVYYDYLSDRGEGWFKDLRTLADRIPREHRGHVAVCLHGWYDYFQQYAYDHQQGKLLREWTAFPGTHKVPMSLEKMHSRLRFAKDLGFRMLLYFADGTNSDSGAPNFRKEYLLRDKDGKTFAGWKGPDSIGEPLKMDPGVAELRDWYRGYLSALLEEYSDELDGFVWDETFYIPTDFVSYPDGKPAHADRAMMSLVAELTRLVQRSRNRNPELAFMVADNGSTNYAIVAHGTFQDSACSPSLWGPSMFANYRNCLWSCNWYPVSGESKNRIAALRFGMPQGISNGYGDDLGPHEMPYKILDNILERFHNNVSNNRVRIKAIMNNNMIEPSVH